MSIATAETYLSLIHARPLRPIRSRADYFAAAKVLESLVMREAELDEGGRDYLETLELLIEAYDDDHVHIGADRRPPIDRLKHLMSQSDRTPADLMKALNVSQPLVSQLLSGKRKLTLEHLHKLARLFRVSPAYFL